VQSGDVTGVIGVTGPAAMAIAATLADFDAADADVAAVD